MAAPMARMEKMEMSGTMAKTAQMLSTAPKVKTEMEMENGCADEDGADVVQLPEQMAMMAETETTVITKLVKCTE